MFIYNLKHTYESAEGKFQPFFFEDKTRGKWDKVESIKEEKI
jgi:hypothetical protein